MTTQSDHGDVRCGYEQIRPCGAGEAVSTIEVRADLWVDLDGDRQVLGVERIGDDVRYGDLCDVIAVLEARVKEDSVSTGSALHCPRCGGQRELNGTYGVCEPCVGDEEWGTG